MKSPTRPEEPSLSLTATVLDSLRDDILGGGLAPGEKLRLEHLTARYGCGRTPLREACSRLAAEGLVVASDQRGFRVAPISRADLLDLTRTRQRIEALALRDAIAHGNAAWEARIVQAHAHLAALPRASKGSSANAWREGHRVLHEALLSACQSPWLLRFYALLHDQSERYRRLSEYYGGATRHVDVEHAELVSATLARDAERAVALLSLHLARTQDLVLAGHPALVAEPPASSSRMSTKPKVGAQRA